MNHDLIQALLIFIGAGLGAIIGWKIHDITQMRKRG